MGIVVSASSIGGCLYPIMLNSFFQGRVGFRWGVRISAFFNLGLLIIANLLMTPQLPPRQTSAGFLTQAAYWKHFFTEKSYVLATLSVFIMYCGIFFPTFFLQLHAVENGLDKNLAFYTVRYKLEGISAII